MQRNPFSPESGPSFSLEKFQNLRARRSPTFFTPDTSGPLSVDPLNDLEVNWSWGREDEKIIQELLYSEADKQLVERLFIHLRYYLAIMSSPMADSIDADQFEDQIRNDEYQLSIYPAVGRELRRILANIIGDSGLEVGK